MSNLFILLCALFLQTSLVKSVIVGTDNDVATRILLPGERWVRCRYPETHLRPAKVQWELENNSADISYCAVSSSPPLPSPTPTISSAVVITSSIIAGAQASQSIFADGIAKSSISQFSKSVADTVAKSSAAAAAQASMSRFADGIAKSSSAAATAAKSSSASAAQPSQSMFDDGIAKSSSVADAAAKSSIARYSKSIANNVARSSATASSSLSAYKSSLAAHASRSASAYAAQQSSIEYAKASKSAYEYAAEQSSIEYAKASKSAYEYAAEQPSISYAKESESPYYSSLLTIQGSSSAYDTQVAQSGVEDPETSQYEVDYNEAQPSSAVRHLSESEYESLGEPSTTVLASAQVTVSSVLAISRPIASYSSIEYFTTALPITFVEPEYNYDEFFTTALPITFAEQNSFQILKPTATAQSTKAKQPLYSAQPIITNMPLMSEGISDRSAYAVAVLFGCLIIL